LASILLILSATLALSQEDSMLDRYFYTYHNPAGNRLARGSGSFPDVDAIDLPLSGVPAWAVAYAKALVTAADPKRRAETLTLCEWARLSCIVAEATPRF
jgi:hypothetical protein